MQQCQKVKHVKQKNENKYFLRYLLGKDQVMRKAKNSKNDQQLKTGKGTNVGYIEPTLRTISC